jgi:tetratricopeptide (TPR) repeat protein
VALGETAEPELAGPDQGRWLDRLEREHDNLRAALAWSLENHQPELGLRLGSALEGFWRPRGYVKEGRAQLLRLLAEPGAAVPPAVRARGLSTAGLLTSVQGNREDAKAFYEESLAIWRRLEDRGGIATVLHHMGWMALNQWDVTAARHRAEETLALRRELGEPRGLADALVLMAEIRSQEGDLIRRRGLLGESITIWQALGDRVSATRGLASLAHCALDAGDLDTARSLYEAVLAAATELGDKPRMGWALFGLGEVAHSQQDFVVARD